MSDLDPAYERGYRDGENSHAADWQFALTEPPADLPDDFEVTPARIAELIGRYAKALDRLERLDHGVQEVYGLETPIYIAWWRP